MIHRKGESYGYYVSHNTRVIHTILESSIGFRKKLTQANKEKFEQAAKFNEEVFVASACLW